MKGNKKSDCKRNCLARGLLMGSTFLLLGFKIYSYAYEKAKQEYRKKRTELEENAYATGYEFGYVDALVTK